MDDELLNDLGEFTRDPYGFVLWAFPWGKGELAGREGPEKWQRELLQRSGRNLSPSGAIMEAVASGHGIGKSALISWIILWATSTCADTRGVVTANTEAQLRTKTWAELAKWFRLFIAKSLFKLEATSLFSVDPEHAKTWRVDMVPWSERNPEAFAGLHNQGRRVFMLYDEGSSIPDVIWETSEGFLSDENTERLWCVFGNPTRSVGRFKDCFSDARWHHTQVDSREVSFTNKNQISAWERAYGEDSDFFRVRVRGVFPRTGASEFISAALVAEARRREAVFYPFDALVMGVDVARFGDDESVICFRRGRDARSIASVHLRGVDTMELAARVAALAESLGVDAIFIDGGGVGGGVVDRCRQLRLNVFDIQFGSKPTRSDILSQGETYANRRAEIWGAMRAWLVTGAIEDDDELAKQLVAPTYALNGQDAIQLERKVDMKARGLPSPDRADALALTFSWPVVPIEREKQKIEAEYDPFASDRIAA